ncbi:MAG: Fic family protein [Candidatus Saccharimonadales bacterium]
MNYQEVLQQVLFASGWSQEELAQRIGVSFVTLNSWVNGKSKPTRETNKQAISSLAAEILGADVVDIALLQKLKEDAVTHKLTANKLASNSNLLDKITLNLTYHTNTIEGSTMTISDVKEVLFDNKILSNRTQVEQREAINHQVAMNFLLDELIQNKNLQWTPDLIRNVHLRLMSGIISNAGIWRNHSVRITGAHVPLANFIKIPELIENLCNQLNEESSDPVGLLARTHAEFEQIHPFSDGNGRTGRLIMFALALQYGLMPPIITRERRSAYYKYLEIAQTKERFDLLEQMLASEIIAIGESMDSRV